MGKKKANHASPGKRSVNMKDDETTPKKVPKLENDATPALTRELARLQTATIEGNVVMSEVAGRTKRAVKQLFPVPKTASDTKRHGNHRNSDSDKENKEVGPVTALTRELARLQTATIEGNVVMPEVAGRTKRAVKQLFPVPKTASFTKRHGNHRNSDSDKENKEVGPARPHRGKTEVQLRRPLATRRRLDATVQKQRAPSKQTETSKTNKNVSNKLAAPSAAETQRTPKKVAVSSKSEPATPSLSNEIKNLDIGTPNRRSERIRKTRGIDHTNRMDVPDEEMEVRYIASQPATSKKKPNRKLVIERASADFSDLEDAENCADAALADDAFEDSGRSEDESKNMIGISKAKKNVPKKLAASPAAKTRRSPKKVDMSAKNEPASPGICSEMGKMNVGTPRRSERIRKTYGVDFTDQIDVSDEEMHAKLITFCPPASKKKQIRRLVIEPTTAGSSAFEYVRKYTLADLRSVLHTSSVPDHLHCREEEYEKIKKFVLSAVGPKAASQAMYISGVPGTGKTASAKAVIREVAKRQKFTDIYINGMEFLDPKQIFVHIYKRITGEEKAISVQKARNKLNAMFETYDSSREPILLLVDELDQLSSRRQEGTNRIIFQPYEFQQIEDIILARTQDFSEIVSVDAVKLAARRVAAISGDLRKAIDTLRRSVEIAMDRGDDALSLQHVLDAHKEATSVALVLIVCNLSRHEELVLSAAVQQVRSKGVEEFNFAGLYREYRLLCTSREGIEPWHEYGIHSIVMKMATTRLLVASPGKNMMLRKLRLGMLLQEAEMALKQRKMERDIDNENSV